MLSKSSLNPEDFYTTGINKLILSLTGQGQEGTKSVFLLLVSN